jgi:HEAT repeat protein
MKTVAATIVLQLIVLVAPVEHARAQPRSDELDQVIYGKPVRQLLVELQKGTLIERRMAALALAKIATHHPEIVAAWTRAVSDEDKDVRKAAIQGMSNARSVNSRISAALIVALDDPIVDHRVLAAKALGKLNSNGAQALAALKKVMSKPPLPAQVAAGQSLFRLCRDQEAWEFLITTLNDSDGQTEVLLALEELGSNARAATSPLRELFAHAERVQRVRVAAALWHITQDKKWFTIVADGIASGDAAVGQASIRCLGRMGKEGAHFLIAALNDVNLRRSALFWLKQLGPDAKEGIPVLAKLAVSGPDEYSRVAAFEGLVAIGNPAVPTLEALIRSKKKPHERIQLLGRLSRMGNAGLPIYLELLNDEHSLVREEVLRLLGSLRPVPEDAIPKLVELTKKPRADASLVVTALIGAGKPAIPHLRELLNSPSYRTATVIGLGFNGGPVLAELGADVEKICNDPTSRSAYAAKALWKLGKQTEAVTCLCEIVKEKNKLSEVSQAASVLGQIGPAAKAALPHLEATLDNNPIPLKVAEALWTIGKHPKSIHTLANLLKDKHPLTRKLAADFLAKVGPEARDAIPALEAATRDGNTEVALAAKNALDRIRSTKQPR